VWLILCKRGAEKRRRKGIREGIRVLMHAREQMGKTEEPCHHETLQS